MIAYHWKPIEDLPDDWQTLASSELEGLMQIWKEQHSRLAQFEGVKHFQEKLKREWAIETGIIENLYSIDRGTTTLLIERGLESSLLEHGTTDKPPELVIAILRDQQDALDGLFDFINQRRQLSTSYIKELHAALTRHQTTITGADSLGHLHEYELIRGDYKRLANNPTRATDALLHEYCPPEHVAAEMDRLVAYHRAHTRAKVPPEIEAAWLHHRFSQIHPFQDGNGRVARILASLVFIRGNGFPLSVHRDLRNRYITACEQADFSDLRPLITLFTEVQKKEFIRVLSISEDILHDREPVRQMIEAVADRLRAKQEHAEKARRAVFDTVQQMEHLTHERLADVIQQLAPTLQSVDNSYSALVDRSTSANDFWFKSQIITIARQLQYYADTGRYRAWVRLKIRESRQVDCVIAFHSLGYEFTGVLAAVAFIEYRQRSDEEDVSVEGPYKLSEDVFQFTYTEDPAAVITRFSAWLNKVIIAGLDQWRRSL